MSVLGTFPKLHSMDVICRRRGVGFRWLFTALFATISLGAYGQVTTYHYDNDRTGANLSETILTTANVNVNTFGKLFSLAVDGQIYAQPLYVPGVNFSQKGVHNVVFVATEHNSVYAFDADSQGSPLWQVNLGPSMQYTVCCAPRDLLPEIGITSTPVIDLNSGLLYVVAETYESGTAFFRLHAIDITTGTERLTPAEIHGSVSGNSSDSSSGVLTFAPFNHWQRPGLLLLNGNIYIAFGSHQDSNPYHGWLFGYSAATLQQTAILNFSPDQGENGVWQGGVAPAADANGNIYLETGNGALTVNTGGRDYGDSVVKIGTSGGATVLDYFSPTTEVSDNVNDWDLGSSGPLLIPGTTLGVAGGKDGKLYIFNTANLGQFHAGGDKLVQEWQATFAYSGSPGGFWGGNYIYYNSTLYGFGERDSLKTFLFNGSQFSTTPASQSTFMVPAAGISNDPAMSISANGLVPGSGIVWAAFSSDGLADGNPHPGVLHAFDAANVSNDLWNSNQNSAQDYSGSWAKWCPPIVANGKVYLASFDKVVNVYGLLSTSSGGGALTGSGNNANSASSLTVEGPADWVHWGDASLNRKAGVASLVSNYSIVGGGGAQTYFNDPRALSWTDGTPAPTGTNNNGLFVNLPGNGFSFTAPADTTTRVLTVHVGGWNSSGTLTAHLSDRSAPNFIDTTAQANGQYDRNYTLTYSAASAGQTITITWVVASGAGNVTLNGAALSQRAGASISATTGTPQSATVNTMFGTALQATVKDASNNPLSGVTVTFTAPASGASAAFSGSTTATATTNASGIAIAPALTANGNAGSFTLTASAPGAGAIASFILSNLAVPPASILATSGTPQSATVNTLFATALQATVKDAGNNPLGGVTVTFAAPASGASATFSGSATTTATTNASGIATGPALTANGQTGSFALAASAPGVGSTANFNLTNLAVPPASILATTGTPQSAAVNTMFATALQATVKDAGNNPLSGVTVTFTAPASGAGAAFSGSATATVTTNASGIAIAPALIANSQEGAFRVTATAAGVATPATFNLSNTAASGGTGALAVSGTSANTTASVTAEGPTDWVHWGDASLNRKAGVTAQISNYSIIGSGGVQIYHNDPRALSWTGGTPTASGTNSSGIFISLPGNGFSFTAPADTSTRVLTVHVGGWNSSGTLTAHLSDGSAPNFVDSTTQVSGQYDRNYTLTYTAASAGQTITIGWVTASGAGNVTLNGAALSQQTSPSISATTGTPQSAPVNTVFATALQVTVKDTGNNPLSGVTVTFTAPATGASAAFSGSATATAATNTGGIAIAPALTANGQAGAFGVTATAAGVATQAIFNLTNTAASSGGGALTGSGNSANSASTLTAEGPTDWVHWGDASLNRKAAVTAQISNYSTVGSGGVQSYHNDPRSLSWSDGTPTASGANSSGLYISGLGNGFSFTAPAGPSTRVLTFHVGGWNSSGILTAHLSDGSAPNFVDSTTQANGQYDRNYTLTYTAASSGQSITISWVATSGAGNVTISAAALN
jgi:hypothetical protein